MDGAMSAATHPNSTLIGAVEVDDGYRGDKATLYIVECDGEFLAVARCGWFYPTQGMVETARQTGVGA